MAWLWACCQPCKVCWNRCRKAPEKKYAQVEYKALKEAPLTTAQRLDQLLLMQQTGNMYLPHPVPAPVKVPPTVLRDRDTAASHEICVQVSLFYDMQRSTLNVQLHEVCNLPPDIGEKCSTKVHVLLSSIMKERWMESKIVSNSQNPIFNQTLEFRGLLLSELKETLIAFQIHHYSPHHSKNVFGVGKLFLKNADIYGAHTTLMVTLGEKLHQGPGRNKGDILLVLTYKGDNKIEGTLMRVTNVPHSSLPDLYIRIDMLCKDQHQDEWKSSVKLKTATPVYNETFQFDTLGMDINDVTLRVTVYERHKITKSIVIGRVVLGHTSYIQSGRDHWANMIQKCGQPTSYWHMLSADLIV